MSYPKFDRRPGGAETRYLNKAWVRHAVRFARVAVAGLFAYLIFRKLQHIGWAVAWQNLPRAWSFYVMFAVSFMVIPVTEVIIYRRLWETGWQALPVMLRKRSYNEILLPYSGEAVLYMWANRSVKLPHARILSNIKDVNLLSGLTSNGATIALLAFFVWAADPNFLAGLGGDQRLLWISVAATAGVVLLVAIFRRHLFGLARGPLLFVAALHALRLAIVLALQVAQWSVALPQVQSAYWLKFLVLQMLLTRLPFLPNRDITFIWASVSIAAPASVSEAALTSMFVVAGVLSLLAQVATFFFTSFLSQARSGDAPYTWFWRKTPSVEHALETTAR